jgi:hypothetical protein
VEHEYLKRMFFTMRQLISDPKIVLSQLFTLFMSGLRQKYTSLPLNFFGCIKKDGKGEFSHLLYQDTTSHLSPWVKKL